MLYLSKPDGTHGVFASRSSQGAYVVAKLCPGFNYSQGPHRTHVVGERDSLAKAVYLADFAESTARRVAQVRARKR